MAKHNRSSRSTSPGSPGRSWQLPPAASPRRPPVSRRLFLQGSALGAGLVVVTAACGSDGGSSAGSGSSGSGGALPIGTLSKPATLPTFDDIPMVASDAEIESGTLKIYNYNDYFNPDVIAAFEEEFDVKVEVTGYDNEDQALSRVQKGAVEADMIAGITIQTLPRFAAGQLLQPVNPELLPESSNVITDLQDPFYDVGAQYTRPYIFYKTGIGYRTDKVDPAIFTQGDNGWSALWDPQFEGYVGIIDDKREAIGLGMFQAGDADEANLNTDSDSVLDAAVTNLDALVESTSATVSPGVYQKLPEGTFHISQAWSGDMVLGISYLPDGDGPEVLGFWNPPVTTVGNDMFAILAGADKPVLAHAFINYMITAENAQTNYEYVGYQPALTSPSPEELVAAELVPANLMNSLVTNEELAAGLRQYTLDAAAETKWEEAWSEFNAG